MARARRVVAALDRPLSSGTRSIQQEADSLPREDGLLRRMDYNIEIAGDTPGAHYVHDYVEVAGIKFPTRRRIYPRQADGSSLSEPLVVSIDLDGIELA